MTIRFTLLFASLFAFALASCDNHKWEDTKEFYDHGGKNEKGLDGDEDEHAKGGDETAPPEGGEKPEAK